MLVINRKLRSGAPFTLGDRVVFQSFGVDIIKSCVNPSETELKSSEDFTGYSADGEYTSANYTRNMYKVDDTTTFSSNEVYDVEFEDSDDVSVL
jgi:hypothetical protein